MRISTSIALSLVLVLLWSDSSPALTLSGNTTGSFASGVSGLTFTSSTFSLNALEGGGGTFTLGKLAWGNSGFGNINDGFTLHLNFTSPVTTPDPKNYVADLYARNVMGFYGNVDVWFDDTATSHLTFTNSAGSGSFDLAMGGTLSNGYSFENFAPHKWFGIGAFNGSVLLNGVISNFDFAPSMQAPPADPPLPEPLTLAGLGLGAAGLTSYLRRRTKKA